MIQNITRHIERILQKEFEKKREFQYEQMINRIRFDRKRLQKDFYKLFNLTNKRNTDQVKQVKDAIVRSLDTVITKEYIESKAKKYRFKCVDSIEDAKLLAKKEFGRKVKNQGSTNLVVVEQRGDYVSIAFVYSHQRGTVNRGPTTAKFAGEKLILDLKKDALDNVKLVYKNKRNIPDTAQPENLQRLHGIMDEGIQTTVAVVATIDSLLKRRGRVKNAGVEEQIIDTFIHEFYTRFNLNRERVETRREFLDSFIIDIEIGHRDDNKAEIITQADRPALIKMLPEIEAKIIKYFSNPDYEGSRSPKKTLTAKGVQNIVEGVLERPRDAKGRFIKVKSAKVNEKDTKKKESAQKEKVITKGRKSRTRASGTRSRKTNTKAVARTQESAIKLRALLDRMLPKVVESKMQQPRLVYRTGRFAQSVRTENVSIGPRGGIHIDYTYMKYPYQTFEPGFAQGSTYRDPRSIIKESIREIAITLVGEKFMTMRRV